MTYTLKIAGMLAVCLVFVAGLVHAVSNARDVSGAWKASFDTQIGRQDYTYVFVAKGGSLTGTITSTNGESDVLEGHTGDGRLTFRENLTSQGGTIVVLYAGSIVSDDEIRFTRHVGEFATEEFVARRARP